MRDLRVSHAIVAAGWALLDILLIRLGWGDGTLQGAAWAVDHLPLLVVGWGAAILAASALIVVGLVPARTRAIALAVSTIAAASLIALGLAVEIGGHESGILIALVAAPTSAISAAGVLRSPRRPTPAAGDRR